MDSMSKWIGGGFIIGAIFWCGATYNRVAGIEQQMIEMKNSLPSATRVAVLELKIDTMQGEINTLRARRP